jgi:hypothetical protein
LENPTEGIFGQEQNAKEQNRTDYKIYQSVNLPFKETFHTKTLLLKPIIFLDSASK